MNLLISFVVGGDGRIYEGTGWHKVGAHTRGYNTRSMGIAVVGDFSSEYRMYCKVHDNMKIYISDERPSVKQISALKSFLSCAVYIHELDANYTLYGGKQVSITASPGIYLYSKIQQWPHFGKTPS